MENYALSTYGVSVFSTNDTALLNYQILVFYCLSAILGLFNLLDVQILSCPVEF